MKIIVGDEKRAPRILLENIFKLKDYETLDARSEKEVVELYQKNPDTSMIFASSTLSNSFEDFAGKLKDNDTGIHPMLFLTVENGDVESIQEFRSKVDDIVIKPFDHGIVESKLELAVEELKNGFNGEDFDPIEELMKEHRLLERMINSYQIIASKMHKEVDKNILEWMKDTAFTMERRLHHKKEEHYMVEFLEKAIAEEGEEPEDKLFNRASLKSVEEEHEKIDKTFKRFQEEINSHFSGGSNLDSLKSAIDDYSEIVKEHIRREERFLFPMSRRYIDEDAKRNLRVEFNKEEKMVGKDKLNKLQDRLTRVEKILGI